MSIVTKTGDQGTTGLMYNRRVPKFHPRIEACGAVDELNAALGMARAMIESHLVKSGLEKIQKELVALMGELATLPGDAERYAKDGYAVLSAELTKSVETWVKEIEGREVSMAGWATPGANIQAASLDVARTACRRAERRACELQEKGELGNREIIIYLNRLSDLLWLLAREAETTKL